MLPITSWKSINFESKNSFQNCFFKSFFFKNALEILINSRRQLLRWLLFMRSPFNGRTMIAAAFIGLLLVFFISSSRLFFTTVWRHNHFKSAFCSFVHEISTEVRAWRFFALNGARFCSFARFLVTLDLPLSKMTHFDIDFLLL